MEKKEKVKNKKTGRKIVLAIALIILILIVVSVGIFIYKTIKNGGKLQGALKTALGHDETTLQNLDPIYCLLVGESEYMTDTIIVASYNPKTQKAGLLSIPRDTFIGNNEKTATPSDKINSLYKRKYPEKILNAVNKVTGLDIQNYAIINTKALIKVIDILGGVWFDVPIDMSYHDSAQDLNIDLKKGYQLIKGAQAEQVLRFRHNDDGTTYPEEYGREDIGRMKTQRAFIEATLKQTLNIKNITKIPGILDTVYENLNTNLDVAKVKDYIPYAVEFKTENLKQGTLPGVSTVCNHYWFYVQDKEKTKEIVDELFNNIVKEKIEEQANVIQSNVVTE